MPKSLFVTLGFILFLLGFISLVLMVVGIKLSFLTWIDGSGQGLGLLIRIIMIISGAIMIVLSRGNFSGR